MEKKLVLNITTNYFCNQKCFFCVDNTKNHLKFLKSDIDKRIYKMIDDWKDLYEKIVFTSWEPTLNKNFWKYIEYSKEKWYKNISLITNGSTLELGLIRKKILKSWLDEIIISIHWIWELHNKIVWVEWAFSSVLKWLHSLMKEKNNNLKINLSFVLNVLNIKFFYKYIFFFSNLWVNQIFINFLRPEWFSSWLNFSHYFFPYSDFIKLCNNFSNEELDFVNNLIDNNKLVLIDVLYCTLKQSWIKFKWLWLVELRETFANENLEEQNSLYWDDNYNTCEHIDWRIIDNNINIKIYLNKCDICLFKYKCEWIYRCYINSYWDNWIKPIK